MKPIRLAVIAAVTLLCGTTMLSAALFSRCRCAGKRFSPCLCLVKGWTPGVRSDLPACRENLIALEIAKYEWAGECGGGYGDEVSWDDLRACLPHGRPPVCNQGGHYVLNRIGEEPDCVGACPLHADPFEHALDVTPIHGRPEGNPLATARAVFIERRNARQGVESSDSPEDEEPASARPVE